jgi:hypothetical protein
MKVLRRELREAVAELLCQFEAVGPRLVGRTPENLADVGHLVLL